MKKIIFLIGFFTLLVGFASCSEDTENMSGNNSDDTISQLNPNSRDSINYIDMLTGSWVYYDGSTGSLMEFSNKQDQEVICNQVIVLNKVGNAVETISTLNGDKEYIANWTVDEDGLLKFNDWNGQRINHDIQVSKVIQDTLVLEIDGDNRVFLRNHIKFNNIANDILGYWSEFTTGDQNSYWIIGNNNIAERVFQSTLFGANVISVGRFEWKLNQNTLVFRDLDMAVCPLAYTYYTIKYCNKKFFGLQKENGDVINLYRSNE